MTQQELDVIKKRCSSAIVGPWHVSGDIKHIVFDNRGTQKKISGIVALCDRIAPIIDKTAIKTIQANAEFIAHARTDIPTLIAEVEKLKAEQPVRCKDCVWFEERHIKHNDGTIEYVSANSEFCTCDIGINVQARCRKKSYIDNLFVKDNGSDFCSYGERKED